MVRDANGCEASIHFDMDVVENYIEFQDTIFTWCAEDGINLLFQKDDWGDET